MKAARVRRCIRIIGMLVVLACAPMGAIAQDNDSALSAAQIPSIDPETAQKLTLAEGYHDLAILYIKKGELDKAVAAARGIIQLRFTAEYEKLMAQSISIIAEKLAETRRFDLGQALLDEALKTTEQNINRVKILRNKARLYMLASDNDRAIESWREALQLESRRIP